MNEAKGKTNYRGQLSNSGFLLMMYRIWQGCHRLLCRGGTTSVLCNSWEVDGCKSRLLPYCRYFGCSRMQTIVPVTFGLFPKCFEISPLLRACAFSTSRISHDVENGPQSIALILLSDFKQLRSSPRPVLALGFAGLLPLICPSMYIVFTQQTYDLLVDIQTFYGAMALSFLCGIQWGCALVESANRTLGANQAHLGQSVIPAVVAWIGLLFPLSATLLALIGGHGYSVYHDISRAVYPSWFRALRFIFGIVAILALWTTFICHLSYGKPSIQSKVE